MNEKKVIIGDKSCVSVDELIELGKFLGVIGYD